MWNTFNHDHFQIKWAQNDWEIEQARRIRRDVFCQEQGLFEDHDTDEIDVSAQVLVAIQQVAGMPEKVVGTVRIHESSPRVWWGSRLAVEHAYRRQGVLGAGLIRLAVSSANTLGCDEFHATVQAQNETLFKRLHWTTTGRLEIQGTEHVKMRAELPFYPALFTPSQGFWVEGRRHKSPFDLTVIEGVEDVSLHRSDLEEGKSWR